MKNTKDNILFITVRSDLGGGPRHLYDLMVGYRDIFNISVACPYNGEFYSSFVKASENTIEIPHRKFSLISFLRILIFVKMNDIRLVHSHGRGAGIYSRLLGLFGLRVVHTFHGLHHQETFKSKLKVFLEIPLSFMSDTLICVSNKEYDLLKKLNINSKGVVIFNGVHLAKKIPEKPEETNVLGVLSRLDSHKNNAELVCFMDKLRSKRLVIAGDGEDKDALEGLIKGLGLDNNVSLIGVCTDIESFFNSIDIYVSASRGEGLPYSVLEAMSYGKKVLVSKVDGHMELLAEENLYELGDFSSFKNKLDKAPLTSLPYQYTMRSMLLSTLRVLNGVKNAS